MPVIHCHVPITVRVYGLPDDDTVAELARAVRRQVAARVAQAEQVLARRRADQGDPQWMPRERGDQGPGASGPPLDLEPAREAYDPARDTPDGYAIPSYDHAGRPVAVPLKRVMVPGRDWRVLRAMTTSMTVSTYLDLAAMIGGPDRGRWRARRVLYDDLAADRRHVTVWLVETHVTTTLGELGEAVYARAAELHHLGPGQLLAHTASPFEGHRQVLALGDAGGQVNKLPSMVKRNARRVLGSGEATELLHGARMLFSFMTLPAITPASQLDLGGLTTRELRLADATVFVDTADFESLFSLPWQAYLDEAGSRGIRVDLLPMRVRANSSEAAVRLLAEQAYTQAGPDPAPADSVPAVRLFDSDAVDAPHVVADVALAFEHSLAELRPGRDSKNPAAGPRVTPGTFQVLTVAHVPADAETRGAAMQRPKGRELAARLRVLLAGDPGDRQWKYRALDALPSTSSGGDVDATRPPGGTLFEYVLIDLDASGDLDRLFDTVEATGWVTLQMRLMLLCAGTRYHTHARAERLRTRLQERALAVRENTYRETVDATTLGGLDLDRDPDARVSIGVPGRNVLGDVRSVYLTERDVKTIKDAAATRLRQGLEQVRPELVADLATGRIAGDLSPDDFLREALARAAQKAGISDDDFETRTVQRSIRVTSVTRRDRYLLPSWDVTFEFVERVEGTTEWTAVSGSVTESADDFEARLIYWRLGRAGEFYQAMGIAITVVGVVLVAWEVGLIAALVEVAGGTAAVLTSIAISELIYIVRVIFFDAKLTLEGFLMAGVEGYLMALGFRAGTLAAAPIGRAIGAASLRRVWTGVVLEKLVRGVVGGGVTAGLQLFARDLVDVIVRDGRFHAITDYVRAMTHGAALGALAEFTVAPLFRAVATRATAGVAELVAAIRREGFSVNQFVSASTEALATLRRTMSTLASAEAVADLAAAFRAKIIDLLDTWAPNFVARRVLEISGATFTAEASAGLGKFLQAAEQPANSEAARRLAATFAGNPQQAVYLMEVLNSLDDAAARRLMTGTFGTSSDMAAFLARIAKYTPDQQRGILTLLQEADLVARPAVAGAGAAQVWEEQWQAALRIGASATRVEAANLRRQAERLLEDAVARSADNARRADALLARAAELETQAAEREALSRSLAGGVDPRPPPTGVPRPGLGADDEIEAYLDREFAALEAGTGGRPQAWIRLPAHRGLTPPESDALHRLVFTSRSGNPVVFRVEGGTGAARSREFIRIGGDGNVSIGTDGKDLNLNVGSFERAVEFILEHRPGAQLKVFEVEAGWLRALRGAAVPEQGRAATVLQLDPATGQPIGPLPRAGALSDVKGLARTVDTRQAVDQLQLDAGLVRELGEFVVPGSGRVLEFVARTRTGGVSR